MDLFDKMQPGVIYANPRHSEQHTLLTGSRPMPRIYTSNNTTGGVTFYKQYEAGAELRSWHEALYKLDETEEQALWSGWMAHIHEIDAQGDEYAYDCLEPQATREQAETIARTDFAQHQGKLTCRYGGAPYEFVSLEEMQRYQERIKHACEEINAKRKEQAGQGTIEIALLLTLVAAVAVVLLAFFGSGIANWFSGIIGRL